jgi:hypothetical protein
MRDWRGNVRMNSNLPGTCCSRSAVSVGPIILSAKSGRTFLCCHDSLAELGDGRADAGERELSALQKP